MRSDGKRSEPARASAGRTRTILELMTHGREIDEAIQRAVREAVASHKRLGNPIAIERDGKAVEIPPEEIPAEWPSRSRPD